MYVALSSGPLLKVFKMVLPQGVLGLLVKYIQIASSPELIGPAA